MSLHESERALASHTKLPTEKHRRVRRTDRVLSIGGRAMALSRRVGAVVLFIAVCQELFKATETPDA